MKALALAILLPALLIAAPTAQSSPREVFERARMLEESNHKLTEAIALYTQVTADSKDRQLAATALLRIGLIHERLGHKAEAERAFRTVLTIYADQADTARQARERLPAATAASPSFVARRVWEGLVTEPLGRVSPDGRYLSYTDWADGSLSLRDLTAGTARRLTGGAILQGFVFGSLFAPDGMAVAFNWLNSGSSPPELRTIRLDTQKELTLFRSDELKYFQPVDWSQDGTRILMVLTRRDATNQIGTIAVPGGSLRVLKTLDSRAPLGIRFSPDGRWIVYDFPATDRGSERDLFVIAADGSREARLAEHPAHDVVLGWSPDGRSVLFSSDRTGSNGAWTVPIVDGRAAAAPRLVRAELGPRVLPLGFTRAGAFYYYASTSISDVYTADFDLSSRRVVQPPAAIPGRFVGAYESADWSPDGNSLAIITQPPGLADKRLVIQSRAGRTEREIPLELSPVQWPRWSPDGTSVLLTGRHPRLRRGFYRLNVKTGTLADLLLESSGGRRAEWTRDGKSLLYARRDADDCLCVVRRDISTGTETVVYRTPRSDRQMTLAPSPDGSRVAVLWHDAVRERPTLTVVPLDGGGSRTLFDGEDLAWFSLLAWTPDSSAILVGRNGTPEAGKVGVWRIPAAGGEPAFIDLAMEGLRDLRVSPDGRRIVFTAGVNRGDVWVMENFLPSGAQTPPSAQRSSQR